MPEVVLRHPKLPKQPIVLDVPEGSKISKSYVDAGWEIDSSTEPDAAREESPRERKPKDFVAEFETDDDAAVPVEPTVEADPTPAEPAPAADLPPGTTPEGS